MSAAEQDGRIAPQGAWVRAFERIAAWRLTPAIALALLWCVPALVVGFAGEIALNDDYAYAWTVQSVLDGGSVQRLPPTYVPIVTSSYWGTLFASQAGFSFAILRFSSWLAGALGLCAFHWLLRESGAGRRGAFLGTAVLAVNPVYLNLAFTFMTDVPFVALTTASLAALLRNLRTGSLPALIAGTLLAIAATLTRQIALALPLAYGVACVLGTLNLRSIAKAAVAGGIVAAVYLLYVASQNAAGAPEVYSVAEVGQHIGTKAAVWHGARHVLQGFVLLGVFLAPLLVWFRPAPKWGLWATGGIVSIVSGLVFFELPPMPWLNIVRATGLGVHGIAGEAALPEAPLALRWGVTAFGAGLAGMAAARLFAWVLEAPAQRLRDPQMLLLLAFVGASLAPYLTRSPFFDRYLLSVVPAVTALLFVCRGRAADDDERTAPTRGPGSGAVGFRRGLAILLLGGLGWFSNAGTFGSLELARTQVAILDALLAQGVRPTQIDGGRAWNAWTYDWAGRPRYSGEKRRYVYDDEWLLSFAPAVPGYRRVSTTPYRRGLTRQPGELHLHRRSEVPPPS